MDTIESHDTYKAQGPIEISRINISFWDMLTLGFKAYLAFLILSVVFAMLSLPVTAIIIAVLTSP